ncbi:hypothetical protein JKF63_05159 [Porcisia hertigi]|uniref:Uncharacterized protein n=1 Tax=Porcisia hertigi TaxID=2761500 RepID=A0A836LI77_9TRYP|nr:hypothetical protein JKF63_05159 [Porcisia hertigi]
MTSEVHTDTTDCPAVGTARVRVRYILTGACPPAYSGCVVQALVPLQQPDGSLTTVETMKTQFCNNCSANMKELGGTISKATIRLLKAGCVLDDKDFFEHHLTATEKKTCLAQAGETVGDSVTDAQKPSVVMHMVVQKNRVLLVKIPKREKNKVSSTSESGNIGEGHNLKKDSCCSVL